MYILGISCFYHDSAAALLKDGHILAAAQEERFTRKKHDPGFPKEAITFCLKQAGISLSQVDQIVFFEKPFLKFERLLETYLAFAPKGFWSFATAMPLWIKNKLFQKKILLDHLKEISAGEPFPHRLLFSEHHLSHAASAFYPSPFEEAVVLTMDGVGEWTTTSAALGQGKDLKILKEIPFPHSLGLLYSAFTYYTGFKVNSGEYKLMGLAPYGTPRYANLILETLIDLKEDGSFFLNQEYFDYAHGFRMTSQKFHELFGPPPRASESLVEPFHMDIAASIQKVTEDIILRLTAPLYEETKIPNLCLAGGVALNCVANGKLLKQSPFKNIWIQPAAGDAGGALGAALAVHHLYHRQERVFSSANDRKSRKSSASSQSAPSPHSVASPHLQDQMQGSYLGPAFSQTEVAQRLTACGAVFTVLKDEEVPQKTAAALAAGQAIGWFQGRMEFGPRALGGRSILADPRSPEMQKTLNLKVKYRESFRPFAPSILREDLADWFDLDVDSPYMLLVAPVLADRQIPMTSDQKNLFGIELLNVPRSEIPAVTHVDYSARIQTVHRETNPRYADLLSHFKRLTGCPVLVNTSFNVRGEPIVCTPEDAFRCFMGTELDVLVVENCFLEKDQQNPKLKLDYKNQFSLD